MPAKKRRWLWRLCIGMVVAAIVCTGLLLTPVVQGWLLQRLVGGQPGWRLALDDFGAGPRGVDIERLDFAMPGLQAQASPMSLRIAPLRLLRGGELRIEHLNAHKVRVTIIPAEFLPGAPSVSPVEPFAGIMPWLRSPVAWALVATSVEGEIAVMKGGESLVIGEFKLSGGGLFAHDPGKFDYEVTVRSIILPPSPANKVRSRGVVRLEQGANHEIQRISVEGDLVLPTYGKLTLPTGTFTASITANARGETYDSQLAFGSSATFDLKSTLDREQSTATGTATLEIDQSIAASLSEVKLPSARLTASVTAKADLRSGNVDTTITGELALREWVKLSPGLAGLEPVTGKLDAALTRRAGKLSLDRFATTLRGEASPTVVRFASDRALDLAVLPSGRIGTVTIDHASFAFVNPLLKVSGLELSAGEFDAEWSVEVKPDQIVHIAATRPVRFAPVTVTGPKAPPIPPISFAMNPVLDISPKGAELTITDVLASTTAGDRIALDVSAKSVFADRDVRLSGRMRSALPSLFATFDEPLPFELTARWDFRQTGTIFHAERLEFAALRNDDAASPSFSLQLLRPLAIDLAAPIAPETASGTEWARLTFSQFPIGWISRWLGNLKLSGNVAAGESVVRSAPNGRWIASADTPWQLADASVAKGSNSWIKGRMQVSPHFEVDRNRVFFDLAGLEAVAQDGSRVSGHISADARLAEERVSTTVALDADLPALPSSAGTFGAVHTHLRVEAHNESRSIAVVDAFEFRVRNPERELVAATSPGPFILGFSDAGSLQIITPRPLTLSVGELPLAWFSSRVPNLQLDGVMAPLDLTLEAQSTKISLRALQPLVLSRVNARYGGHDEVRDGHLSLIPGLDLTLICVNQPTFQIAYSGTAYTSQGELRLGSGIAMDVDMAVSFVGDHKAVLPSGIEFVSRVDLGVLRGLPVFATTRWPSSGTVVTRLNGDLLGKAPLEWWSRIEGIPSITSARVLSPIEITARGKLVQHQTLDTSVTLRLVASEPSDLSFHATLDLVGGNLQIASGLHSTFLDLEDVLTYVDALGSPPKPARATPRLLPAASAKPTIQAGAPFWSTLRGHFELDLAQIKKKSYRINGVRGLLDVGDRDLVLRGLEGEMFSGRWGGNVRVAYQPENEVEDHALTAEFNIAQFDSSTVIQTVFETEKAAVNARIDLTSKLHSEGNSLVKLIEQAAGDFTIESRNGVIRLAVPKQDVAATAVVFGGAVLLSPEIRALGRLLKKFAEMPVDHLRISGSGTAAGEMTLSQFQFDSPQVRMFATGSVHAADGEPLMNRPLSLSIDLAAKDEMAVILGGMSLIDTKPRADGFHPLKEQFKLGGKVGRPDTQPLYDLLARAVTGSKGTWGLLMRSLESRVKKLKGKPKAQTASSKPTLP
ncbi:MAG: hypothetical protein ABIZ04_11910 [Opitutus sp.]